MLQYIKGLLATIIPGGIGGVPLDFHDTMWPVLGPKDVKLSGFSMSNCQVFFVVRIHFRKRINSTCNLNYMVVSSVGGEKKHLDFLGENGSNLTCAYVGFKHPKRLRSDPYAPWDRYIYLQLYHKFSPFHGSLNIPVPLEHMDFFFVTSRFPG